MSDSKDTGDLLDRTLADRFARMRRQDRGDLPDFPDVNALQSATPVVVSSGQRWGAWKFAGLAAAITAVAVLIVPGYSDDPGEVYADIMQANIMVTDQLMLPLPGVLPEVSGVPGVYSIELSLDQPELAN